VLIIADDPMLTRHLVHALATHCQWLRRSGLGVPAELSELLAQLSVSADRSGLEWPPLDLDLAPVDARLMTYSEAAQALNVSARTVRRWVRSGRLPCVRLGRLVRIPTGALEEVA
jgi:excisionase family DNA binding protein